MKNRFGVLASPVASLLSSALSKPGPTQNYEGVCMAAFSVEAVASDNTSGATIVRMIGSADLSAEAILEREVTRLTVGHHTIVVLDLTELDMISSLALGQFVQLHRGLRRSGGCVRIVNPSADVRDVFVRSRLTEMLQIFPTVEAAIDTPRS